MGRIEDAKAGKSDPKEGAWVKRDTSDGRFTEAKRQGGSWGGMDRE